MSLFGTLNTSVSGMSAQASKLSAIGDNIANASTTGYKRATTEFETLLGHQATSNYESGGVQSRVRYAVSEQGTVSSTTSTTDLAIQGNGFFVVQSSSGAVAMTRAGSFVKDDSGNLVNSAGYKLMGYDLSSGSAQSGAGTAGLELVDVSSQALTAQPSTTGTLSVNLPSNGTAVAAAALPSTNAANATYTSKTSLVAYDNLGNAVTLDMYMSKTSDNTWQVAVYNHADASTGGSFPYSTAALTTQTLNFDGSNGHLVAGGATGVSVAVPNGGTVTIDMSKTTQLAADFSVTTGTIDGSAPSKLDHVSIGTDGIVTAVYANGNTSPIYQIALASVESPDNLTSILGNVYEVSSASGAMQIGAAGTGSLGKIESSALESSNVDLATELTSMISAQRGYEANSKVLQTSSDLLSVINNLRA